MRYYMSYNEVKKIIITLLLMILLSGITNAGESPAGKEIKPNITPGEAINRSSIPETDIAPGVKGRVFWGKSTLINWMTINPDVAVRVESRQGDCVLFIRKGTVSLRVNGSYITLEENECIYVAQGSENFLKAGKKGAEVLDIYWSDVKESMRYTEPSFPYGTVIGYYEPQFCQPAKNLSARIIQGKNGQMCFARFAPDADLLHENHPEEQFMIITRGWFEKNSNGKTVRIKPDDILYLTGDIRMEGKTGPKGCNAIIINSPSRPDYTRAMKERLDTYHTIIPPDAQPMLLIDGSREKPNLTFTEGPSWMNGRLYFSNYYKFWKPWGSSDEGGVWVIEPDGTHRILNKDVQTCGTTPLPNGNLAVCDLLTIRVAEMTPDGNIFRTIVDSYNGKPLGVANDLITDRKGGLYITDAAVRKDGDAQPGTALYYFNSTGKLIRVTEWNEVDFINGVVLSPDDKILFLNGSREINVWMFDVGEDGILSNKRPFAELYVPDNQLDREKPSSIADGMTIDSQCNVYVATALGIQVFDRTGRFIGIINFPKSPSNCIFGGDDLTILYATCRDQIYSIRTKTQGNQYPIR